MSSLWDRTKFKSMRLHGCQRAYDRDWGLPSVPNTMTGQSNERTEEHPGDGSAPRAWLTLTRVVSVVQVKKHWKATK